MSTYYFSSKVQWPKLSFQIINFFYLIDIHSLQDMYFNATVSLTIPPNHSKIFYQSLPILAQYLIVSIENRIYIITHVIFAILHSHLLGTRHNFDSIFSVFSFQFNSERVHTIFSDGYVIFFLMYFQTKSTCDKYHRRSMLHSIRYGYKAIEVSEFGDGIRQESSSCCKSSTVHSLHPI